MDALVKDLRHSLRCLFRQPAFTAMAVLTLGLGIGAIATIFSIINALILTPPLIEQPDRVVALWKSSTEKRVEGYISYPNLQDWKARAQSFDSIAGYKPNNFILTDQDNVERIKGMRVTANLLDLLKVKPFRGRGFQTDEEQRGSDPVAMISYEFWQNRFGGAGDVLSRQILLNGKQHSIVGILPPGFEFPLAREALVWTTVAGEGSNLSERGANVLRAVGRLKPGESIERAQAEMTTLAASLAQEYPRTNANTTVYLVGIHEQIVGHEVRRALWLLLGAVVFILLIACTNTANLLLVRAISRQKEIAIRGALGAGRWRIARQLLTESVLLSIFSGGAGLLISLWGLRAIKYYGAEQLPRLNEVHINGRVLLFTLSVSMLTGVLFSLVPALKASRPDINEVLKSGTKAATSGLTLRLWRDVLVVSEVALSLILMVGAGLMIKSLTQLVNVPPGFDPEHVLTGSITFTRANYDNPAECVAYVNQTLARLRALPGVESAAFVAPMPFSGGNVGSDFKIEGHPKPEAGNEPTASNRSVTPEYFAAMKIPLLRGRYFNDQDKRGVVGAAIVNRALVEQYFGGEDPIGQRISNIGANQNDGDPEQWEIVGIVGDVHHSSLTKAVTPEIYLPYEQNSWTWGNFLIRTTPEPAAMAESFRHEIRAVDKSVPLSDVRPLTQAISRTLSEPRFYTLLFGLFGAVGLVLTMVGVYGLISYTVTQRTREIGIRMALGATRQNVVSMILRHGIVLALAGTVIGLITSFALTRLIASLLFEVKPTDRVALVGATLVLLLAAFLASYVPARRATRVDPLEALRYE